jgi:PKD repeat protein
MSSLSFGNIGNQIDSCWQRPAGWNNFGARAGGAGSAPSTGPTGDVSGTGNYLLAESSLLADSGQIESPLIYLPPSLSQAHLKFAYHLSGPHIDSLVVLVDTGAGYHIFYKIVGEQQPSHFSPWLWATASLIPYLGDTLQLQFKAYYSGWTGDITLDEVEINNLSCLQTLGLNLTARTTTSLSLGWQAGSASHWQVEYGPAGFLPGTGTRLNASTNALSITGLNLGQTYDFYVRDSCGPSAVGYWSAPVRGGLACQTVLTAPWHQNFDGPLWQTGHGIFNAGNIVDQCWDRPEVYNGHFGTHTSNTRTGGTGPSSDVSGTGNYIYSDGTNDGPVTGRIESPLIYIPDTLYNPMLKFNYHMYGASIQSFRIRIDSGSGFLPASFLLFNQQQPSIPSPWRTDSISLEAYRGDTIRLRFIGQSNGNTGDIALDEIAILADSSTFCAPPQNLSISSITPQSAMVNWLTSGAATRAEITLASQAQGTGQIIPNAQIPLALANLVPNTRYVIYLTDSCKATAQSQTVTDTFTTNPCPGLSVAFGYSSNFFNLAFTSAPTQNADSLHWTFGDGNSSSQANPSHIYPAAGQYVVGLTAFSICDSVKTFTDTIQVCDTLFSDFTFTTVGDSVNVAYTGSSGAINYHWFFDGKKDTTPVSTGHRFGSPGPKIIVLNVFNACGDSATLSKQVTVCNLPQAIWSYNVLNPSGSGLDIQFDATASLNAQNYFWDFGDGNSTSGSATPIHTYTTPSLAYLVTLRVTNACAEADTFSSTLLDLSQGEEDAFLSQISFYPNPVKNILILENTSQSTLSLNIMTSAGQSVFQKKLGPGTREISLSHLPAGLYLIRYSLGNSRATGTVRLTVRP